MKKLLILLAFFYLKVDGQVLNIFPEEPVSVWHPGSVLNVFGNYEDWPVFDTVFQNSVTIDIGVRSPFSEYVFDYSGTSLNVQGVATLTSSPFNRLTFLIDGIYDSILSFTATPTWKTYSLPAGQKRITIVEGATSKPPDSPVLGTRLTGLKFDSTKYQKVNYVSKNEKYVFLVNSIGVGDRTMCMSTEAWTRQFNSENNKDVAVYGWGYAKLMDMAYPTSTLDTTVSRLIRLCGSSANKNIIISLGTNDYSTTTSKDTIAKYYSLLVDSIHSKSPTATIFCVAPIYRYNESSLMESYRSKIDSISIVKNFCIYINPYSSLTYPADYNDAIHPNLSGHNKLKDYIYPITQIQSETKSIVNRFKITLNREQILGIDSMVVMLKDSAIWNNSDLIYVFNTNDSASSLQNWKSESYTLSPYGALTFTSKSGFISNGITGYFKTGWIPSLNAQYWTNDSCYFAEYSPTTVNTGSNYNFGVSTPTNKIALLSLSSNLYSFTALNSITHSMLILSNIDGLFISTRTGTVITTYRNNVQVYTEIDSEITGLPAKEFYILAVNNNENMVGPTKMLTSFFAIGGYLNTTQLRGLNNIIIWWNNKVTQIF
jgi:hypothetical protein